MSKSPEDILLAHINKFKENVEKKHSNLTTSYVSSLRKITVELEKYLVGEDVLNRVYDFIHWAEQHEEFKDIELEAKNLADTFWD